MRVLGMSSWIHLRGALAIILMLAACGDSDGGASAQPLTGSTTHGETMASLGSESGATTTESTEASSVATTEATTPEIESDGATRELESSSGTGELASGGATGASEAGASTGKLDAGVCLPVEDVIFDGDVVLDTSDDLAAVANYTEITGSLWVGAVTWTGALDWPNLRRVGGSIYVENTNTTAVRMPNLIEVGGELWVYLNSLLLDADFRSLTRVGDRLWIYRNRDLAGLHLDALAEIDSGDISVQGNLVLPECFATALRDQMKAAGIPEGGITGYDIPCDCERFSPAVGCPPSQPCIVAPAG